MNRYLLLFCFAFFVNFFAINQSSGQVTTFDNVPPLSGGGNTAGGVCFNFSTNNPIHLDSLRCAFSTATGTATIWYNPNKINGQPVISTANGWINLGSATFAGISSATTNPIPQTIPIGLGLTLNANDTIGLAIQWTGNVYPTTNVSTPVFTNGIVSIIADASCAFTFNSTMTSFFTPRQINGGVVYRLISTGPDDAGLSELTAPSNFCADPAPQAIKVKVRNFGNNVLSSAQIHWQLDGVAQTTYSFSTPLDTFGGVGINEQEITLGSHVFGSAPVDFKAWTALPNGVADTSNGNDTLTATLHASLSGTYTINSALATGGTNYQSFTEFSNDLNTFGVCGPVIANVSGGPFIEKVEFGNITGASSINTIKINGNGATVQFANTSTDRQLLTLDGTKYLTIDSLIFKTLATDYGWAALITGYAAYDSITNCFFDLTSITSISSANTNGITFSGSSTSATTAGSNGSHCYIGNNHLKWTDGIGGGYYALSLVGTSDSNVIANNVIENYYYYGTYISATTGNKILNNEFHKTTKTASLTTFYGIYSTGVTPGLEIIGNRLHTPGGPLGGTGSFYGIYALGDGSLTDPVLVANNAVYDVNQNGVLYGIYLSTAPYNLVYHNTIVYDKPLASTSVTYGIYSTGTNTNTEIKNNNVVITGGTSGIKYGFYYSTAASVSDAQKNNFYINSTQTGVQNYGYYTTAYATQTAFQAAYPLLEVGSPTVDPLFVNASIGNFNVQSPQLIGNGVNLQSLVPFDINGNPRPAAPTIGAFEQPPAGNNNAGMLSFVTPTGNYCAGQQSVSATINNAGINNITSLKVNWTVNGVVQPQFSYSGTLVPITSTGTNSATVVLGNATIPNGTPTLIKAWTSLPNGVADIENANDTITLSFQATQFLVTAASDTICSGGDAILNLTPNSGYAVGDLQWQSSPNGTTWTGIPSSDAPSYTAGNLTTSTFYRVKIGVVNSCFSDSVQVAVSTVGLVSTTPGTRCGPGTVNLGATGTVGTNLNWYSSATSPTPIGSGSSFTTPSISATTDFWVSSSVGGGVANVGPLNPSVVGAGGYTTSTTYVTFFTVLAPTTINSVDIFANTTGGSSTIEIKDLSSNTVVGTYPYTISTSGSLTSGQTVAINQSLPPGSYSMGMGNTSVSLYRNTAGANFPFTSPQLNLTGQGFTGYPNYYYYFYNWEISSGCESPRQMVTATIKPQPVVNLGNDTSICSNASLTLDAGNAGSTFLWDNNTTAQTLNITTAGTYSVTVTGANLCSNTDTINVAVGISPLNNLPATVDLCFGDTITLDAGNAGSTYLWSNAETTQTTDINTAGTYDVLITSPDGCPLTSSTTVVNRPLPIVDLGVDTAICAGDQIVLDAGNPGMNYLWNTGANSQTITVSSANTYSVTVTSVYNCKASDSKIITNLASPTVDAFNFIDLSNEQAGKVQFAAVNPQNVTNYDWDFGDNTAHSTDPNPIHIYTSNGIFAVILKVTNGCGESQISLTINVETVGITKLDEAEVNYTLYPNPSNKGITIENGSDKTKMQHISIVNVLGSLVYDAETTSTKVQKINTSNLASGLYTVRILTDKGMVIKKFEVIK